jgi:hypothetical protein
MLREGGRLGQSVSPRGHILSLHSIFNDLKEEIAILEIKKIKLQYTMDAIQSNNETCVSRLNVV